MVCFPVLLSEVENSRQSLPNYEDLSGVAAAFMRLQDTYKLDTSRLAEGNIHGRQISALTGWNAIVNPFHVGLQISNS